MRRVGRGKRSGYPPEGEAWGWHTRALICSPAWRGRSINCVRFMDFLEIEHLKHRGKENGRLLAPYSQLVDFGITRRLIAPAIREAERRGLVCVERGGKKGTTMTELSRYRLTYWWTRTETSGIWYWQEPTDEWKLIETSSIGPTAGTAKAPHREPSRAPHREQASAQDIEIASGGAVPFREPPSISRVGSGQRKGLR